LEISSVIGAELAGVFFNLQANRLEFGVQTPVVILRQFVRLGYS
jgi:hypothetical protein